MAKKIVCTEHISAKCEGSVVCAVCRMDMGPMMTEERALYFLNDALAYPANKLKDLEAEFDSRRAKHGLAWALDSSVVERLQEEAVRARHFGEVIEDLAGKTWGLVTVTLRDLERDLLKRLTSQFSHTTRPQDVLDNKIRAELINIIQNFNANAEEIVRHATLKEIAPLPKPQPKPAL